MLFGARAVHVWFLGGLVGVGAALRFASLDAKGFWVDEAVTVFLVRGGFEPMVRTIPEGESTPPLYYLLVWGWTKLFGTGEVGIRSFSALVGTFAIPTAYAIGTTLVSRRVGIVAAALVAVNPLLVTYSQDARAYALLVVLAALSFLFFVRALREQSTYVVVLWAVTSALAMATHYFAGFLVAAEAVWLVYAVRRSSVAVAVGAVATTAVALFPLALHQRSHGGAAWIADMALSYRVLQVPAVFLVGEDAPAPLFLSVVAVLLALPALVLLFLRADVRERDGALLAGAVALSAVIAPLALAVAGPDYFLSRNVVAALVPGAIVLAAAFGSRQAGRVGLVTGAMLCVWSLGIAVAVGLQPARHLEDWRGAAEALGPANGDRIIVATPPTGTDPLALYLPRARPMNDGAAIVREIAIVALSPIEPGRIGHPSPPRPGTVRPPARGFELVEHREEETFTLVRFRAPTPSPASEAKLRLSALDQRSGPPIVLVER